MAVQKGKQAQEFDVKAAAKRHSDRIAATAISADSFPAKPHVSCRSRLT